MLNAVLPQGHGTLSLVTTERGTIKDDTVISNHGDTVCVLVVRCSRPHRALMRAGHAGTWW